MSVGQTEVNVTNIIKPNFQQPLDIILLSHDHFDMTIRCVTALYENTMVPFHLIVVDNSKDFAPEYFKWMQTQHDNITFYHQEEDFKSGNLMFNIGLQHGSSEFFATVMNSITVEPEWEVAALDLLTKNPDWGMIGVKCLFHNTGLIESAGIQMLGYTPVDLGKNLPGHRLTGVYECEAVQWACAILRKEAAIGNLDEDTFNGHMGWDDIDNCFVLRDKGWKIFYCGLGAVYHEPRATRGKQANDMEAHKLNRQNAHIFYKRWGYWDMYKKSTEAQKAMMQEIK